HTAISTAKDKGLNPLRLRHCHLLSSHKPRMSPPCVCLKVTPSARPASANRAMRKKNQTKRRHQLLATRRQMEPNHSDLNSRQFARPRRSDCNPLDFIERDLVARSIVKLRRARALVRRHFLRILQRAAGLEIGGNAHRPEGMAADLD